MRKMTKRSAIISGVAVAAIGVGATAWAAGWGVTGSGTGSAQASELKTLSATATLEDNVYPGAKTKITLNVTNPNDFPVKLTANSFGFTGVAVSPAGADAAACKAGLTPNSLAKLENFKGNDTVPGKNGTAAITADLTVGDLPEKCAGKSFSVTYKFSGVSA